jgi:hypothetical protein
MDIPVNVLLNKCIPINLFGVFGLVYFAFAWIADWVNLSHCSTPVFYPPI